LDLKTDNLDGVTQTLYATGMSPGATVGLVHYYAEERRHGQWNKRLDIVFSYTESDGNPNIVDKTADEVAAMIEVVISIMEVPAFWCIGAFNGKRLLRTCIPPRTLPLPGAKRYKCFNH